jgi:hypothetical protein
MPDDALDRDEFGDGGAGGHCRRWQRCRFAACRRLAFYGRADLDWCARGDVPREPRPSHRDAGRFLDPAGYVAGGHLLFGTQYPAAVVWTSPDGLVWTRANEPASFSQGKIQGIAAGGLRVVAVGSFGSPDFSIPTVWVSPGA